MRKFISSIPDFPEDVQIKITENIMVDTCTCKC